MMVLDKDRIAKNKTDILSVQIISPNTGIFNSGTFLSLVITLTLKPCHNKGGAMWLRLFII